MSKSNDDIKKRIIGREFPHQVAVQLPSNLGMEILRMNDFCRENRFRFAMRSELNDGVNILWYCFADHAHAEAFVLKFPGKRHSIAN